MGLLAVGALLRALLLYFPRSGDDDTDVYAELGRNLLHHGTYGMFAGRRALTVALPASRISAVFRPFSAGKGVAGAARTVCR